MNLIIVLSISSMLMDLISSQTTKDPGSSKSLQPPIPTLAKANMDTDNSVSQQNTLWVYRPGAQLVSQLPDEFVRRVAMRQHSLTRLAKTLSGFDPIFNRGNFEPFERRPKPVTLVAFRKNGLLPRSNAKMVDSKSAEIAELQSPYNDISTFWVED